MNLERYATQGLERFLALAYDRNALHKQEPCASKLGRLTIQTFHVYVVVIEVVRSLADKETQHPDHCNEHHESLALYAGVKEQHGTGRQYPIEDFPE